MSIKVRRIAVLVVVVVSREFKKLRRLLQRKRHVQIELSIRLSVLRLFQVGHAVQNRRSALSFAKARMVFM